MMIEAIRRHPIFFCVVTFFLFCSFAFNAFGAVTPDEFILNHKSSEALVVNQVVCNGDVFSNQMLEVKGGFYGPDTKPMTECDSSRLTPYISQYGLQGKIYTLGYKLVSAFTNMGVGMYIASAQLVTALFSAIVFGFLALWVRTRYGVVPAIVFSAMILISPMVVGFSRNLYWALPLFLLPLLLILFYFRINASRRYKVLILIVLGLLLYLRYLCGYEYLTTITIMVMAGVVYHLYVANLSWQDYIKQVIIVGIISIVAFLAALTTHVISLNSYTGSTQQSAKLIQQRAEERTIGGESYLKYPYLNLKGLVGDHYKITDTYLNYDKRLDGQSMKWSVFVAYSTYALLPIFHLPLVIASPLSIYVQSMMFFVAILGLLYLSRKKWLANKQKRNVMALFLAAIVGLIGYLSWLILGLSHSLVHAHINGILMYMPFALFGYTIVGVFIEWVYKKRIRKRK